MDTNEDTKPLHRLIKIIAYKTLTYRQTHNIPAEELAERISMSTDDWYAIERAQKSLNVWEVMKIAKALGTDVTGLVALTEGAIRFLRDMELKELEFNKD